ncbi:unnamed protein product [Clonostachys solani]|uniref:Uncharacterized protein n=1 Tax=Clonostachys solani TaxID=160281 RepID=A0A9N9VYH3_9HYPO|nr:unnamed protein product [Clonostachys solani]
MKPRRAQAMGFAGKGYGVCGVLSVCMEVTRDTMLYRSSSVVASWKMGVPFFSNAPSVARRG